MDNNKRNAIIITLVISTAFTMTACGDKPSSNSSFSDSNSSYSASADINSSIEDNSSLSEQPAATTSSPSTTQSVVSNQPAKSPPQTAEKSATTPHTTTAKVQAGITPPPTTTQVTKKLIVPTAAQCQVIENEIIRLVNQYRASKGLHSLTVENKLMQAAGIRAEEASNCYNHNRPDGTKWATVLDQVQYGTPYEDISIINGQQVVKTLYNSGAGAENLAATNNLPVNKSNYFECTDTELKAVAQYLFNAWKNSPDHNKSIVNTIYAKMGAGIFAQYETTLQGEKRVVFYGIQLFTMD